MSGMKRYRNFYNHVVEAQPIAKFEFDRQAAQAKLVLEDGTVVLQPRVHGFHPVVGDYYVRWVPEANVASSTAHAHSMFATDIILSRALVSSYLRPIEPETAPSVFADYPGGV